MEDLRLRHIAGLVRLSGRVSIYEDDFGTSFCPTIADFNRYSERYIIGISASNETLEIHIKEEI